MAQHEQEQGNKQNSADPDYVVVHLRRTSSLSG